MNNLRMKWLYSDRHSALILHISKKEDNQWGPYFPYTHPSNSEYSVPDYRIPKGSKGWATYQKLFKLGVTLVDKDDKPVCGYEHEEKKKELMRQLENQFS